MLFSLLSFDSIQTMKMNLHANRSLDQRMSSSKAELMKSQINKEQDRTIRATGGPSSSNGFDESIVVLDVDDDDDADGPLLEPNPGRSRCARLPSEKCFPLPCRARLAAKWLF